MAVLAFVMVLAQEPEPAEVHREAMRAANLAGEEFCWSAAPAAEGFLDAFEAYEGVRWLEEAERYYDVLLAKLGKDPDGYEGWIGPARHPSRLVADSLAGDALLCAPLFRFAEIAQRSAELKARFGERARRAADLGRRIVWDKWNRRGAFVDDAYRAHPRGIDPETGRWVDRPSWLLTEPLHAQSLVARALVRLWRLTNREEYRDRAEKILTRAKALWRHVPDGDRLTWNYWTPLGAADFEGRSPRAAVGVHPERGIYQAVDVACWVEAYDAGLVFDAEDVERLIRTNLWMSYGRRDGSPGYKSSDGSSDAGVAWTSLSRFDETIRKAHEKALNATSGAGALVGYGYLKNVTERRLGMKPLQLADPAKARVAKTPLQAGGALAMALPIPAAVDPAEGTRLAALPLAGGALKIELLDAQGKDVLGTLHNGLAAAGEFFVTRWDGTNPRTGKKDPGDYRVRWTLGGESRAEPVRVLRPGGKRASPPAALLKPGQSVAADFEKPLDARWLLEGAVVSEEAARTGKAGLKLSAGDAAFFGFGGEGDLPVRVTLWLNDTGKMFGRKAADGPAWGVRTADGNSFRLRFAWRPAWNGDLEYVWTSTAEGQPFAPHLSRIPRKRGWTLWTFDFTDPAQPRIFREKEALGNAIPEFLPRGAAGIVFSGGDPETGPLYIDDVTVELPKK